MSYSDTSSPLRMQSALLNFDFKSATITSPQPYSTTHRKPTCHNKTADADCAMDDTVFLTSIYIYIIYMQFFLFNKYSCPELLHVSGHPDLALFRYPFD